MLDEKGIRIPSGEVEAKEAQQAGRYLDADLVVGARAYRVAHSLVLEAEMIGVATGEIVHLAHASSEQRGTLNVMLDEAHLVGRRLAGIEEVTEVTQPASDHVSELPEPGVLTSDVEPFESEEPEAPRDRSFLWGLAGFMLTAVPGAICLGISAQSAPEIEDAAAPLGSTAHGRVLAAVRSDHLDVIGHFDDPHTDPPHFDWLTTGTGFTRKQFEAVWGGVLDFLTAPTQGRGAKRKSA